LIRLLFAGRPTPHKGLSVLIESLRHLQDLEWELSIIGEVSNADLDSLRRNVRAAERITLYGPIGWNDVAEKMRGSDVLIVPSNYETFGNVALEGMACGCVIVASKAGGLIEFVDEGENGFLFDIGDSKGLAHAIRECIMNPLWLNTAKQKSIEQSKMYSWEIIVVKTIKLFERLTSQ